MSPAGPSHDFDDPRAFRWVESGVSGLARTREWDATALVDLPELENEPLRDFELTVRRQGPVSDAAVPAQALERIRAAFADALRPPLRARAVRQDRLGWLVGAVELGTEEISLSLGGAASLEVVWPPGGGRQVYVDGEEAPEPAGGELAEAVAELERRGRARFESFVARADKVSAASWDLTIDPL